MLFSIRRYARCAFRHLGAEQCEDAVEEVIANAAVAFARLAALGKTDLAYPTVLARYGIAQVRDGRRVGDVLSPYAQRKTCFLVDAVTINPDLPKGSKSSSAVRGHQLYLQLGTT
jgi:hypothetical protein